MQEPDRITIDGKQYSLVVNPLAGYFARHPDKIPKSDIRTTNNWRGYVAHFAVTGTDLTVVDVRVPTRGGGDESVMKQVFSGSEPVAARWFSGHLVIPDGNVVPSFSLVYGSEFERYIVVRVQSGSVVKTTRMRHDAFTEFRREQFAAFKRTQAYRTAAAEAQSGSDPLDAGLMEGFLYELLIAQYMSQVFE